MKALKWVTIILLVGYILACMFGCSPSYRMARLIKKHPELAIKDTIKLTDTLITQGTTKDSNFTFSGDTVYIKDSILTIKYFYNKETHKHYIKGEVKSDTIIKEIKVPYDKFIIPKRNWWDTYKDYIIVILLVLIAIFAFKR